MQTLEYYLHKSISEHWAVPHFNISDRLTLRGICEAAKELSSPVMIGTSEGERDFIGLKPAIDLVKATAKEFGIPLFLNADHSYSVKTAKDALDAGYESVHIDLSKEKLSVDIGGTKEIVDYANKKGGYISIEGEVGYLVTDSSKVYDKAIEIPVESLTTPEQAKDFVNKTGITRLAAAVGTIHGIAANTPKIDIKRIEHIRQAVGPKITLVLHGGSGATDADVKAAITAGINCVHINTEIRVAYVDALKKSLRDNSGEVAPYKILGPIIPAVKAKALQKIKLFGSKNKI